MSYYNSLFCQVMVEQKPSSVLSKHLDTMFCVRPKGAREQCGSFLQRCRKLRRKQEAGKSETSSSLLIKPPGRMLLSVRAGGAAQNPGVSSAPVVAARTQTGPLGAGRGGARASLWRRRADLLSARLGTTSREKEGLPLACPFILLKWPSHVNPSATFQKW